MSFRERVEVPWWDVIKIPEGVVNRVYHWILRMTPEEAWVVSLRERQEILSYQQLEWDGRNARRRQKRKEEDYLVGEGT